MGIIFFYQLSTRCVQKNNGNFWFIKNSYSFVYIIVVVFKLVDILYFAHMPALLPIVYILLKLDFCDSLLLFQRFLSILLNDGPIRFSAFLDTQSHVCRIWSLKTIIKFLKVKRAFVNSTANSTYTKFYAKLSFPQFILKIFIKNTH